MKKLTGCFIAVVLMVAAMPLMAQVKWSDKDFKGTLAEADQTKSYVMIDFFATWCGPCKYLDRMTWSKAEVGDFLTKNHINAIKIDVDKDKKTPNKYGIKAMPTIVVLNGKGEEINRFMGFRDAGYVVDFMKGILKDPRSIGELRKSVESNPDNIKDAYSLSRRMVAAGTESYPIATTRKYLDIVLKGDPDNAKGMGATALANRVALGISEAMGGKINYMKRLSAKLNTDAPNVFQPEADEKISGFATAINKSIHDYQTQIERDCTAQLIKARKAVDGMKDPDADADALNGVDTSVTGNQSYGNRDLCEAYYLFLASITKDPTAMNSSAWYFYVSQTHLDLGLKLAREAVASKHDPMIEDTLAHLLFVNGKKDEAIKIEEKAINRLKEMKRAKAAAAFRKAIESWKQGKADQLLAPVGGNGKQTSSGNPGSK